jgi:hypothetical protein
VAYNFQTENTKIKLFTDYENATQTVLLSVESVLQNAKSEAHRVDILDFEKTLPGFDQHLPAKCSGFPLLFGAEHYQSLEIALTSVRQHYLNVDFFHIEFCNDAAF